MFVLNLLSPVVNSKTPNLIPWIPSNPASGIVISVISPSGSVSVWTSMIRCLPNDSGEEVTIKSPPIASQMKRVTKSYWFLVKTFKNLSGFNKKPPRWSVWRFRIFFE